METEIETRIYEKLGKIENEIVSLKAILPMPQTSPQIVSLGGMLKGVEITEADIKEAKSALFKVRV